MRKAATPITGSGGLFLFNRDIFLGMDYVIVLVAHIEEPGQLAETVRAIRDANIPHLDRHVHLAVDHVADSILAEFTPDRACYVKDEKLP